MFNDLNTITTGTLSSGRKRKLDTLDIVDEKSGGHKKPTNYLESFSFVNAVDQDFECGICKMPVTRPVCCFNCRNLTCYECLKQSEPVDEDDSDDDYDSDDDVDFTSKRQFGRAFNAEGIRKCPLCNLKTPLNLFAPKVIEKQLQQILVQCDICSKSELVQTKVGEKENSIVNEANVKETEQSIKDNEPQINNIESIKDKEQLKDANQAKENIWLETAQPLCANPSIVKQSELTQHWKKSCLRECRWNCGTLVLGTQGQQDHETSSCSFAVLDCMGVKMGCKWKGTLAEKALHIEQCPEAQLTILDNKKKDYLLAIQTRMKNEQKDKIKKPAVSRVYTTAPNTSNENELDSKYIETIILISTQLVTGTVLDVQDRSQKWWKATILHLATSTGSITNNLTPDPLRVPVNITVKFDGWDERHNETIGHSSYITRLAPLGTHTVGNRIEQERFLLENDNVCICGITHERFF